MTRISSRDPKRKAAKIKWLLANQKQWEGYKELGDPRHQSIIKAMKDAGIVAATTYWKDVNLHDLIIEARQWRRNGRKK